MQTVSIARTLYLVAYDIADPRRLASVARLMKGWKVGGQKSFCECWLTAAERTAVLASLDRLIDAETDRVHLFQLDPRMPARLAGVAQRWRGPLFTIV